MKINKLKSYGLSTNEAMKIRFYQRSFSFKVKLSITPKGKDKR